MPQSAPITEVERAPRDWWTTSLPSFGAQSNYLHHDHVAQAGTRRSVFTVAERFSHHISPDYPGEKSSVTFPQITHTWSESNLHKIPPPPCCQEGPDHDPNWETSGVKLGVFGGSDCGESWWKKMRPLAWIHNSCSSGRPCGVPVLCFLHTCLLFIIVISAGTSFCYCSCVYDY